MPGCAVTNITGTDQSYFFKGDKYVKIKWTPGTSTEEILYGPTEFAKEWIPLKEAGFHQVDAILPIHGHDHRAYFFCGNKYARIEYTPSSHDDKILGGVRDLHSNWASIKKAGFDRVDGALMVPGTIDEAYIFCGENYCRIRFHELKNDDELVDGPKPIMVGWSVTGFTKFDSIFPRPGNYNHCYIFSEGKYVQIRINVGGKDELISSDQRAISSWWKSLHKAGFY